MTVIVASNRVARAKSDEPMAGGLATALIPMVKDSGAIWVGSSGQTADSAHTKDSFARIEALGTGALATVDMPAKHYHGYYEGFANSALWPALHSRPDLIRVTAEEYASYREVNTFMARALLRFVNRKRSFGSTIITSSPWAPRCAGCRSADRSVSFCTRHGPTAAP